mmetsp:Transcript_32176/g.73542  ORF Transcript_32176/g.73542 Transcript_32176/m.73542 type:complete len:370 (+) Transcript_32176:567-1676(+)
MRGEIRRENAGKIRDGWGHGLLRVGLLPGGRAARVPLRRTGRRRLRPPDHLLVLYPAGRVNPRAHLPGIPIGREGATGQEGPRLGSSQRTSLPGGVLPDHGERGVWQRAHRSLLLRCPLLADDILCGIVRDPLDPRLPMAPAPPRQVQFLHVHFVRAVHQHFGRARFLVHGGPEVRTRRPVVRLHILQHLRVPRGVNYWLDRNCHVPGDNERLELSDAVLGHHSHPNHRVHVRHGDDCTVEHRVGHLRQGGLHVWRCGDRERGGDVRADANAGPHLQARPQGAGGDDVRAAGRLPELRGRCLLPDRHLRYPVHGDRDEGAVQLRQPQRAGAGVPLSAPADRDPAHVPAHPEQEDDRFHHRRKRRRDPRG